VAAIQADDYSEGLIFKFFSVLPHRQSNIDRDRLSGGFPAGDLFSAEFINSVASSLDDFDSTNLFRPDGDINFERDFGEWFNGDDSIEGLDMK